MTHVVYVTELTGGREEIASILEGVADGVRAGDVRLGDGADSVSVEMPDELFLEVDVETEGDLTSLELEIEWPRSEGDSAVSTLEESPEPVGEDGTEDDGAETPLAGATVGPHSLARFEVFQDKATEWRWRLRHRNGNVIATSGEGYTRKHNALKGLKSVIANSPEAEISREFSE
jgi:amphi-Trp domain-containing protein